MDAKQIIKIFEDTAYVRMGGTEAELKCAEYLQQCCAQMGLEANLEPFEVDMATIQETVFLADGKEIPCKGYFNAGSGEVEAPFYYLRSTDSYSLSQCKGKIVMIDGYLGYWMYQDLLENGAVGFVTYDGNVNYSDCDIDQRELRSYVSKGNKIPGVNINAKSAVALVSGGVQTVKIVLKQEEYKGQSHNVVLDMPGEIDEYIVLSAHYDSTSLSQGAYDNMSGSVGLLGSKAYVAAQEDNLKKFAMNINMDMIGCIMGGFVGHCTAEEAAVKYLEYFASEKGFAISARQSIHSSDSTPFADKGVPAVSFARYAPPATGTIHNSYDTMALMSPEQLKKDIDFIAAFAYRMANSVRCPISREIPDNMKEKLDIYLTRKRAPKN